MPSMSVSHSAIAVHHVINQQEPANTSRPAITFEAKSTPETPDNYIVEATPYSINAPLISKQRNTPNLDPISQTFLNIASDHGSKKTHIDTYA